MTEPVERCRKHVPRCQCDWHDEDWRAFAREYGIELPEVDETCRHHPAIGDDDG